MANSKSAKKRILVAERNRVRNQAVKTRVKTMAKKVLSTIEVKDVEAAKAALSVAYKEFDKAVSKGILKKNTASRKKARLAAKVNSFSKFSLIRFNSKVKEFFKLLFFLVKILKV